MSGQDFGPGGKEHLQLCLERDRLLCSPEFARSPVMSKLLAFLVNYKLEGHSQPLKAYTIAVEALGRSEDFDPHTDSYPRVIIGRLRKIIDNYYLRNPGATRVFIPLNQYEIMLEGAINTTDAQGGQDHEEHSPASAYPQLGGYNISPANGDLAASVSTKPYFYGDSQNSRKAKRRPLREYILVFVVVALTISLALLVYFSNG